MDVSRVVKGEIGDAVLLPPYESFIESWPRDEIVPCRNRIALRGDGTLSLGDDMICRARVDFVGDIGEEFADTVRSSAAKRSLTMDR